MNCTFAAHLGAFVAETRALVDPGVDFLLEETDTVTTNRYGLGKLTGINQPVHFGLRHANAVEDHDGGN